MSIVKEFDRIFHPQSVAVLGASREQSKLGYYPLKSLIESGFTGKLHVVHPTVPDIAGFTAYPSIGAMPGEVDLVVISLPNSAVLQVLTECAEKGVKGAVIITAGFKESEDEKGAELQKAIATIASDAGIRIIGPNTFGMFNTHANLNASFTPYFGTSKKGGISFITQSGGITHSVIPQLLREDFLGISKVVGLGNRANTDFRDMIEYLSQDPTTEVIAMYMEGIDHPGPFLEAARKREHMKPVIVYKVGAGESVRQAAMSHTGSLAGRQELYDAAFSQAGVISTNNLMELVDGVKALALQPPPRGNRIAIASPVAGPALVATDVCEDAGLCITKFSSQTQKKLNELIPPIVARTNPVDWANTIEIMELIVKDENVDMLICTYAYTNIVDFPSAGLVELARTYCKPIIVAAMSPEGIWQEERAELERNHIPVYPMPDRAAHAAIALTKYGAILRSFQES